MPARITDEEHIKRIFRAADNLTSARLLAIAQTIIEDRFPHQPHILKRDAGRRRKKAEVTEAAV